MFNQNDSKYFAADEPEKTVAYLQRKASYWYDSLISNNYLDKIKRSWMSYHGAYYEDSHSVGFGGEQGELVTIAVNHYRNIGDHMIQMVTANRPAFQPRAINTDHTSQVQTTLAHGLLDYYMREKRLERKLEKAVEYAVVLGSGYIKMGWNATSGKIYDYIADDSEPEMDEEGNEIENEGFPVYDGDIEFINLSPYDVVFDTTKETSQDHDWVLTRSFKNKYDLAAKYPEYKDKIKELQTKSDITRNRITLTPMDETLDVPVYEFYHNRTEALPEGRYVLYLNDEIILMDTPMPYRRLPVYRMSPADILGTPFGYTNMWDLLPIQDAINSLYSTILTNQNAFGVQNILNPRGNDIKVNSLEGALNFIEYNAHAGKPEPLNLTHTPAEIFNFVQMLVKEMETISGVNSVARGNPEASLRTGTALALVQSQALQFLSGLQRSYVQMIEDVGTGVIELLQDFAATPRIAELSGIANETKMKYFKGDDLKDINRVVVDSGNALAMCLEKDTEVLMYDGSIALSQDIKIGDKLMGHDSKQRTVGSVASGIQEMFKVVTKDKKRNIEYGCNKSHILTLRYCSDDCRYNAKKGDILDISVSDYIELSDRQKNILQGFTTKIEFNKADTMIPPYIMGTWIGDGTSANTSITSMDDEIIVEWENYAERLGLQIRVSNTDYKAPTYHITSGQASGSPYRNKFMNMLREMNLINNKYIPEDYLINDRENRLELLAGLIDTDGSLIDQTFIFTQKCNKITDSVVYLAKSLGFRVNRTKTYTNKDYQTINKKPTDGSHYNEYNKLSIGGDTWAIPTRIERKKVKEVSKQKNWNNYGINVKSVGIGEYYGFSLLEDPHFVLGNFVVTHNSTAGKAEMASNLIQMGLITSPDQYFSVINTGRLDTMTQGKNDELLLIKKENERLFDGENEVLAIDTDNHALHINEHRGVLADPDIRINSPELVERTLVHIQEHMDALRTVDPDLLAVIQQQAIQPQQPPGGGPQGGGPPALLNDAQGMSPEGANAPLPDPAQPAQSPDGQPVAAADIPLK